MYFISIFDPEHEFIRSRLEKYLHTQTGIDVKIHSILPLWKDHCISVNRVNFNGQQGETIYDIIFDKIYIRLGFFHFDQNRFIKFTTTALNHFSILFGEFG